LPDLVCGLTHPSSNECVQTTRETERETERQKFMALADHRMRQEDWAKRKHHRAVLPDAYGEFLSKLADWDWFVTITFRDILPRDLAIARIEEWLADIQAGVGGKQIGWILAEEFGRIGGRYHCHMLVTGVGRERRKFWWSEAFRRFGRSEIRPFDPQRAAAFYAAKYAAKQLGEIQFGGLLSGRNLHHLTSLPNGQRHWDDSLSSSSAGVATHSLIAPSAEVESFFYKRIGKCSRPYRKRRTRNIQKVSHESGQTVPQNRKLF